MGHGRQRQREFQRRREPRRAGPFLVAAFAIFMGVVGGLLWYIVVPGAQGRNALVPEYPVKTPTTGAAPIVTVQTVP